MQRFSEFPYTTWADIELALVPYKARLGKMAAYYESEISKIMDMFNGDDFRNNKKLSGEFLLAYHCQKEEHYRGKKEDNKEEE
jgi:CRISPR-associated protein Csd1